MPAPTDPRWKTATSANTLEGAIETYLSGVAEAVKDKAPMFKWGPSRSDLGGGGYYITSEGENADGDHLQVVVGYAEGAPEPHFIEATLTPSAARGPRSGMRPYKTAVTVPTNKPGVAYAGLVAKWLAQYSR